MKRFLLPINKLQFVRIIYWLFLTYMVAAFVWWYVSLEKQNNQIAAVQFNSIQLSDPALTEKVHSIQQVQERKNKQFLGEGVTFLFLFLLGAIYVYRSLLKQINYSNQQQNFMMAITHELKTPIAITHLNLETLLKRQLDQPQQKKIIEVSLQETQRLDALCNNILLASQLDMGQYQANKQWMDMSAIVKSCIQSFQDRFPQHHCVLQVEEGITIQGEPVLIQLLVNNLLDNAHKYSNPSDPIHIELKVSNQIVSLFVKDLGVGVPNNEKEKIFQKFYRVGTEYTRSTKGTGLGLYLCKQIAQFHDAQLLVTSNTPKGSIFTFNYNLA
jgi:signal transduction histidine kinase